MALFKKNKKEEETGQASSSRIADAVRNIFNATVQGQQAATRADQAVARAQQDKLATAARDIFNATVAGQQAATRGDMGLQQAQRQRSTAQPQAPTPRSQDAAAGLYSAYLQQQESLADIQRRQNQSQADTMASLYASAADSLRGANELYMRQLDPSYRAGTTAPVKRGTLDVNPASRGRVQNPDGTYSTVDTFSREEDGKEVLVPTVINVNGRWVHVDEDTAWRHYQQTGEHFGKFNTPEEADAYARQLHEYHEDYYANGANVGARANELMTQPVLQRANQRQSSLVSGDPKQGAGKYLKYLSAADFAVNSQAREDNKDATYNYINGLNGERERQQGYAMQRGADSGMEKYQLMTDEERGVYNYLYNTQGKTAANGFLARIEPELNEQYFSGQSKWATEQANQDDASRFLWSTATVGQQPVRSLASTAALAEDVYRTMTGQGIDPNSELRRASALTEATRRSIAEHYNEQYPNGILGFTGGDIYNTIMSAADSAMNAAFSYAGGQMLSALRGVNDIKKIEAFTNKLGSALMSSEVAATSVAESKEKGYTDLGAMSLGLVRGYIEYMSEKLGGEWAISWMRKSPLNPAKVILQTMIPEGVEELMSDFGNETVNMILDNLLGTKESYIKEAYDYFKENGSENPWRDTLKTIWAQEVKSFVGGALAAFGTGTSIYAQNRGIINETATRLHTDGEGIVKVMEDMNTDNPSAVYRLATLTKADSVEALQDRYQQVAEAFEAKSLDDLNDMLEQALEDGENLDQRMIAIKEQGVQETENAMRANRGGLTYATKSGKIGKYAYNVVDQSKLSRQQKVIVDATNRVAQVLGVNVTVIDAQGDLGGAYLGNGNIYLNIGAGTNLKDYGKAIASASFTHELTHWMKDQAQAEYEELKQAVTKSMSAEQLEQLIREQMENQKDLTPDAAMEEVVANACQNLLQDSKAFAQLARENQTLAQKILDFLRDFTRRIRSAFAEVDFSDNLPIFHAVQAVEDHLDEMQAAFDKAMLAARGNVQTNENTANEGGAQMQAFKGYDQATGRGIYESNFPAGTPASAKQKRLVDLVQNVFSKKPIDLVVQNDDGTTEIIQARFDPDFDETGNRQTDLGKLAYGNRQGNRRERRVTLNLADDYYQILQEARYITGDTDTKQDKETHKDIEKWRYFVNDILYQEQGEEEKTPYSMYIDVKKTPEGEFVYTFHAEEDNNNGQTTPQIDWTAVNSSEEGTANGLPKNNIANQDNNVKLQSTDARVDAETEYELNSVGSTALDGVVVAEDLAQAMRDQGFSKPVDAVDQLTEQFQVWTTDDWKANYLAEDKKNKLPPGDPRVANLVTDFTEKMITNDAIMGYVPSGHYAKSKFGPLRKNIEYRWTFDMDASCPRTFQFVNYRNALQQIAGRPLTENEALNLMFLMRRLNQQIPCTYCYVENKRVMKSKSYLDWFQARSDVMNAETDEEALKSMYSYDAKKGTVGTAAQRVFDQWRADVKNGKAFAPTAEECWTGWQTARNTVFNWLDAQLESGGIRFGNGVRKQTSQKKMAETVCKQFGITEENAKREIDGFVAKWRYDVLAEIGHTYDIANDTNNDTINQDYLTLNRLATNYASSSSQARLVDDYIPYTDQLKNVPEEDKKYIMGMGGIRKHSSNDFRMDYVQDYLLFYADLARGGWTGHTYTKSVDFCKFAGRTGDRINLSIAMNTQNGKIVENQQEGAAWKQARELRKAYDDLGVMAMVTDNAQLSFALKNDWIDMCIPFHASGLPKAVWYNVRAWFDYANNQLESYYTGAEIQERLDAAGVDYRNLVDVDARTEEILRENPDMDRKDARSQANAERSQAIQDLFNETFGIKVIRNKNGNRVKPHFFPNDTEIEGPNGEKQIVPGHHNDSKLYMQLCEQYGVHPRFYNVKVTDADGNVINVQDHPNYVKLIKETSRIDTDIGKDGKPIGPQKPIQFNFDQKDDYLGMSPLQFAMQRMEEEAKNGGFANTAKDSNGIVDMFANLYLGKDRDIGWMPSESEYDSDRHVKRLYDAMDVTESAYLEMYDADVQTLDVEGYQKVLVEQTTPRAMFQTWNSETESDAVQLQTRSAQSEDEQHNSWAPEFYSKLQRTVEDWTNGKGQPMGSKMSAGQVLGWLKGKGVKAEEIRWSGIEPWLEGKKSVTRDELLQVMAENQIQIQTETLGGKENEAYSFESDDELHYVYSMEDLDKAAREVAKTWGYEPDTLKKEEAGGAIRYRTPEGNLVLHAEKSPVLNGTKWDQYTLPGGKNYREILFSMPALEGYVNRAMKAHWNQPNVIAHARVQDLNTSDGRRVLFVEEAQSDLHNAGATAGFGEGTSERAELAQLREAYSTGDLSAEEEQRMDDLTRKYIPSQKEIEDLNADIFEMYPRSRLTDILNRYTEAYGENRYITNASLDNWIRGRTNSPANYPDGTYHKKENIAQNLEAIYTTEDKAWIDRYKDLYKRLGEANRQYQKELEAVNKEGAPDVPFAGSADTYHEYVMKHMLRLAAEGDYDYVGWTTAQQQSDRWSDEYAEGYRIEYDQNIPKFMNKYSRQWGSKVETIHLDNGQDSWGVPVTAAMKQDVLAKGQPLFQTWNNEQSKPKAEQESDKVDSDIAEGLTDGKWKAVEGIDIMPDETEEDVSSVIGLTAEDNTRLGSFPASDLFGPTNDEREVKATERAAKEGNAALKEFTDRMPDDPMDLIAEQTPVTTKKAGEDKISTKKAAEEKTTRERISDAWHRFVRSMANDGDAIHQAGRRTGNKALDGMFFYAKAATLRAQQWIQGKRTSFNTQDTGEGLNAIFDPIRAKGDDYYRDFQLYMYHMLNVERMSRSNGTDIAVAKETLSQMAAANPELASMSDDELERRARQYREGGGLGFILNDEQGEMVARYWETKKELMRAERQQNKPVFGFEDDAPDADASKKIAQDLIAAHPEFEQEAQKVYDYTDALLQYRVDAGLITEADMANLKSIYPHYVPVMYDFGDAPAKIRKGGLTVSSTIKSAKGGNTTLLPLHYALAKQTLAVMRNAGYQQLGAEVLKEYENNEGLMGKWVLDTEESDAAWEPSMADNDDVQRPHENVITVFRDGKRYDMTLSEDMAYAFNSIPGSQQQWADWEVMRKGNDLFKKLCTAYNPLFMITNPVRDVQDALLYSTDMKRWIKNYPKAIAQISGNGKYWEMYKSMGAVNNSYFDWATGENANKKGGKPGKVEALNLAIEQAPRLAEYMTVLENAERDHKEITQQDLMEAFNAAAEITTNFSRGGTIGRWVNRNLVPFWNPGVQGLSKAVRTVTETKGFKNWALLGLKAAALGMVPALLNGLLYRDDDEWDIIDDQMKLDYYLFKGPDGVWIKIPKGRMLAALSAATIGVQESLRGDEVDWAGLGASAIGAVAPNNPLETNLLSTLFQAQLWNPDNPGKTWYGGDIESQRLRGYAPGERYDESTDVISKWLGGKLNISPKKISYVIDQYSGVLGDLILPYLTPKAERGLYVGNVAVPLSNAFMSRFTTDTVTSNTIGNEYYGLLDQLGYKAKAGDTAAAQAERYMNRAGGAVSDYYAQIRKIENDENLTDKEKSALVRELRKQLNVTEQQITADAQAYLEAAQRYIESHPEYDYTDDDAVNAFTEGYNSIQTAEKYYIDADAAAKKMKDEVYMAINREHFGAEYALQAYNKDTYAKAQKLHDESGLSYEDYFDYYFGSRYIYADKDSEGKSISGSKKEKIVEYIDTLDIPDDQKDALFKANNYKDLKTTPWHGGNGRYTSGSRRGGGRRGGGGRKKNSASRSSKPSNVGQLSKGYSSGIDISELFPSVASTRRTASGTGLSTDLARIVGSGLDISELFKLPTTGTKAPKGRTRVDFEL